MSHQQQAGWEWAQEDERLWHSENMNLDRDMAMYEHFEAQQSNDRLLADFDGIFMNEGE